MPSAAAKEPAPAMPARDPGEPMSADDLAAAWKRVTAEAPSMMMRTLLEHARLASVAAGVARVVVAPGMRSLAEGRRGEVEQLLARHAGVQARIELEVADDEARTPGRDDASGGDGSSAEPALPPGADDRVREHPLVKQTARVFGAPIAKVKPKAPAAAKPTEDDNDAQDA